MSSAPHIIETEIRSQHGTGGARAVRREGKVPGILYGGDQEPVMVSMDPRVLHKEMHSSGFFSKLFNLKIGSKQERAVVRHVQFHPVTDQPLHVDFMRVSKGHKIHVSVQITFANEDKCPGLKKGGVLNIISHSLELMCDPDHLPDHITIDLADLDINHSIHINDIVLPKGASVIGAAHDTTIATLVPPTVATETAAAEPAATEPAKS